MTVSTRALVLTPGEPTGIGPDLVVSLSRQSFDFGIVIIADPDLLQERAARLGISLNILTYDPARPPDRHIPGHLIVLPAPLPAPVQTGQPDIANAARLLTALDRAVDGCLSGEFAAMVTGPLHKAVINDAGYPFSGHTEYIAERCGRMLPVMMLMNSRLKVALVTTHLALKDVPAAISGQLVEDVLLTVHRDMLTRFKIAAPRIHVCGLNPHAGERGYLGREEIDHIEPAIQRLRQRGLRISGPLPADTAFTEDSRKGADVIVSMYHDQGLPVLKALGFGETVNITLGLPLIRTSVDHGTAFELAGTGKASDGSLLEAVRCAAAMAGLIPFLSQTRQSGDHDNPCT